MSTKSSIKPRRRLLNLAVLMALGGGALAPASASAASLYWAGASCGSAPWDSITYYFFGSPIHVPCWSTTSGGAATVIQPQHGDDVYLTQSDATNRAVRYWNTAYPSAVLNSLRIDATGTGTMTLNQEFHPLAANVEFIGWSGTGAFNQSGGTNTVGTTLLLGYLGGSSGSYNLSGTGSLSAGYETIGLYGTGAFTQSGGTNTVGMMTVASQAGSSGTYTLNGGTLNAGNIYDGAGTSTFNLDGGTLNLTGSSITLDNFIIGNASGSNGSFTLGSGKTLTSGYETIGYYGTGRFTQSGGTNTVGNDLILGHGAGSQGYYDLNGTGSLTTFDELIGNYGVGSFSQSGGTHTVSNALYFGYSSGGHGVYNLTGGSLDGGNLEYIGYAGIGTFNQTGGVHTVSSGLFIGDGSSSHGTYTLSGTGALITATENIGNYGTGTFNQAGGTNWVNSIYLGVGSGGNGSYNLSAGDLTAAGETVGYSGTGAFTQSGGTNTASTLYLGSISGGNGSYNQSAGSLSVSNETIGLSGTGAFTQSGGTHSVANSLTLGQFAGGNGTYNLNGGTLNVGSLDKGAGSGSFNFNAGTLNIAGNLALDTTHLLNGVVLTGVKTLNVSGITSLSGTGTLTLDGGTFSTGSLVNNGGFAFNRGTFNLTSANLTIGAGGLFGSTKQFSSDQTVNVTNTTTINSGSVLSLNNSSFSSGTTNNNGQIVLGGVISNLGGGTLNNAGRITGIGQVSASLNNMSAGEVRAAAGNDMVFAGAGNTNNGRITLLGGSADFTQGLTNGSTGMISGRGTLATGTTAVTGLTNQGNLALSGTTDIIGDVTNTGTGRIVVSGGATATFYDDVVHNGSEIRVSSGSQAVFFGAVSGAGAYTGTGTVFFEGDLRPGNSPALVNVQGDMTLGMLSHTTMELGGLTRGAQYDAFDVGGTLSLDGLLDVALYDLGSGLFTPHAGDSFDLFTAQTILGSFSSQSFATLSNPNLFWRIDYLTDYVGTTDVVRLSVAQTVTPVPEPETYAMLLAGLGLLGFAGRRRNGASRQAA